MEKALEIDALTIGIPCADGRAAVGKDISLSVEAGKTLALVGESGCGKSVTALAVMGLLPEGFRVESGSIRVSGLELNSLPEAAMRRQRGSRVSMIFQDPMTALNPLFTVGEQISEVLQLHRGLKKNACRARTVELLRSVRIPAPETRFDAYPHELSGGMRQRVMIVMALACSPGLLIADEPTTALDVTVQAQIFDLLAELQRESGAGILLITHNLSTVADTAHETAVLYAGRCVEHGRTEDVLRTPLHPYSRGLIACAPRLRLGDEAGMQAAVAAEIPGIVPPLGQRDGICAFAPRCILSEDRCFSAPPEMVEFSGGHSVACRRHQPDLLRLGESI
jgi:peptide/nickel transport system ATP-binding protein